MQAGEVLLLAAAAVIVERGSIPSLVGGAAFLLSSMWISKLAVQVAFRRVRRPGLAVALFLLKLAGMLVVAFAGVRGALLSPMSFAIGATTLPVAIVIEACYGERRAGRRPVAPS